jgi:hypothetical protein
MCDFEVLSPKFQQLMFTWPKSEAKHGQTRKQNPAKVGSNVMTDSLSEE